MTTPTTTGSTTTAGSGGSVPARRASYGNWVPLSSPGLFGAGLVATGVFFVGLLAALVALLAGGLPAALVVAVLFGTVFVAVGTPVGAWVGKRAAFAYARARGYTVFRSGLFSPNADAGNRLPGRLARTTLLEADLLGGGAAGAGRFAVVCDPRRGGLYTVVAQCAADGPAMVDPADIDARVAGWARFLTALAAEPALVCVKAITDTAPDTGGRLAATIAQQRAADSAGRAGTGLAAAVLDECAATYPVLASANTTWVEVTFRAQELCPSRGNLDRGGVQAAVLEELARRVPGICAGLAEAGGGTVDMVTGAELAAVVASAYDPTGYDLTHHLDPDGMGGMGGARMDVAELWRAAGPVAAVESWGSYRHDSGISITWEMTEAPRSSVPATALAALCGPHPDLDRKRVALIVRPYAPDRSTRQAESDAATALFNAGQSARRRRVSATESARVAATEQSRHEVASGAVLVRFSLLVTATVSHAARLAAAEAAVTARAGTVPIRLRRCHGSQAAAFAATLPAGFVPTEHTRVSDRVRELM